MMMAFRVLMALAALGLVGFVMGAGATMMTKDSTALFIAGAVVCLVMVTGLVTVAAHYTLKGIRWVQKYLNPDAPTSV